MARQLRALILAGLGCAGAVIAQDSPRPEKPAEPATPAPRRPGGGPLGQEFGNVRRALEALTPEQRQRFVENLKRWSNLQPEEKKALADRDGFRRKKMAEEIDAAITDTGLPLQGDRRALFAKRYAEERRKLEEQLRKELEEKRRPLLQELVSRLKVEFSAEPAATR